MTTCDTCPDVYPWLGNTRGADTDERDLYEKLSIEDYEYEYRYESSVRFN